MIIKNARVYCDDFKFRIKDVFINDGYFVKDENEVFDKTVIDASGKTLIPGLIDVHTHGACGTEFSRCTENELDTISKYHFSCGVTSFCATTEPNDLDCLKSSFSVMKNFNNSSNGARLIGINMEGPYISPEKLGAMNIDYVVKPDYEAFKALNEISGNLVKLITVAPDVDGALDFIEKASKDVTVAIGHTVADYDLTVKAIECGAKQLTHLYNAMPPIHHRNPGVIGAAADGGCMAELICDGFHIHPSAVRIAFKIFGSDRMVLISDAVSAMGMPDGTYGTAGMKYTKCGFKATFEDGMIVGSVTNLFECFKKAVSFGISEEDALRAVTANPAKSIGVYDVLGSVTPGKKADFSIIDKNYNIEKTFVSKQ